MPRRNRPKGSRRGARPRESRIPSTTSPIPAPTGWQAQIYRGGEPDRDYVCPRCHQTVKRSSEHVVAWSTEAEDERHRHWHKLCWESAKKEGLDPYRWE